MNFAVKRLSVKRRFDQMYFRSIGIRSNGVRSNGFSVKWPFDQKCSVKWFFGKVIQNPQKIPRKLKTDNIDNSDSIDSEDNIDING
jgi:hypothetical protein